eukprot:scaffold56397_cov38-Phaeocystis_antarctica.AAC.2
MARAVAVLGELAQPQGHCRAPQRATDLPGGSIPGRWVRVLRAAEPDLRSELGGGSRLGARGGWSRSRKVWRAPRAKLSSRDELVTPCHVDRWRREQLVEWRQECLALA